MQLRVLFPAAFLLFGILPAIAVNHIVTFGSSLRYSPDSLAVEVGDTITWQGAFNSHPLESTSVPSGAAVFGRGTGTMFSYTVTVAGEYNYHCSIHFSLGMVGQFTATATSTGIGEAAPAEVNVFPLITTGVVNVSIPDHSGNGLRLELLNVKGRQLGAPTALDRGTTAINLGNYSRGIYFFVIRNDEEVVSVRKVMKQ